MEVAVASVEAGASAAPSTPSSTSSESRPVESVDRASSYMSMMETGIPDSPPEQGQEDAAPEDTTSEQAPEVEAKADAHPEDTPVPEDELPPDIEANLKRIHPEARKKLRDAYFRNQAFEKAGFTWEHAQLLKQSGFTPERAVETLRLFPTHQDAERTVNLAQGMQKLRQDFSSNPAGFLTELYNSDPNAYGQLMETVAAELPNMNRDAYVNVASRGMWTALGRLANEADGSGDPDLREAVRIIQEKLFPGADSPQQASASIPDEVRRELEALRNEKQTLTQRQQQFEQQRQQQFEGKVLETAREAIFADIAKAVGTPSGFTPGMVKKINAEVAQRAVDAFVGNQMLVNAYTDLVQRGTPDGRLTKAHFDASTKFLVDRTRSLLPSITAAVLREWTEGVMAQQQQKAAPPAKPRPPAGAPPSPRPAPDVPIGKGADAYFAAMQALNR